VDRIDSLPSSENVSFRGFDRIFEKAPSDTSCLQEAPTKEKPEKEAFTPGRGVSEPGDDKHSLLSSLTSFSYAWKDAVTSSTTPGNGEMGHAEPDAMKEKDAEGKSFGSDPLFKTSIRKFATGALKTGAFELFSAAGEKGKFLANSASTLNSLASTAGGDFGALLKNLGGSLSKLSPLGTAIGIILQSPTDAGSPGEDELCRKRNEAIIHKMQTIEENEKSPGV